MENREKIIKEFKQVINRNCLENESDTPDYILAEYLVNTLENLKTIVRARDKWFDFHPWRSLEILEESNQKKDSKCNNCFKKDSCKILEKAKNDNMKIGFCEHFEIERGGQKENDKCK